MIHIRIGYSLLTRKTYKLTLLFAHRTVRYPYQPKNDVRIRRSDAGVGFNDSLRFTFRVRLCFNKIFDGIILRANDVLISSLTMMFLYIQCWNQYKHMNRFWKTIYNLLLQHYFVWSFGYMSMTLFSLRELLAGQKKNSLPILFSVFGGRVDTVRTEYLRIKFTT